MPDLVDKFGGTLRWHPYGPHGILIAAPLSILLWVLIALPFLLK